MSQFEQQAGHSGRGEISESAFEYMLGELLNVCAGSSTTTTMATTATMATATPDNVTTGGGGSGSGSNSAEEDKQFEINQKLDDMGYSVGYRLVEKLSSQSRFIGSDHLEIVKFICKEFWEVVFKKKVKQKAFTSKKSQ